MVHFTWEVDLQSYHPIHYTVAHNDRAHHGRGHVLVTVRRATGQQWHSAMQAGAPAVSAAHQTLPVHLPGCAAHSGRPTRRRVPMPAGSSSAAGQWTSPVDGGRESAPVGPGMTATHRSPGQQGTASDTPCYVSVCSDASAPHASDSTS